MIPIGGSLSTLDDDVLSVVRYFPADRQLLTRRSLICVASVSVAECSLSVAHPVVVYCD